MVIALFRSASPDECHRVREMFGKPRAQRTREDVAWLRGLMDQYGCIEYARSVAHAMAGAAEHEASVVYANLPDSRDKQFLRALPRWVLARA
jgi:geranylgeranyl diphosphate synthase type II